MSVSLDRWGAEAVGGMDGRRQTGGGQMAEVVLVGIVVLIFFAVGFVVGVLIVGVIGRWRNDRQRRTPTIGRDADRN